LSPLKVFLLAGEPSGDIHGAALASAFIHQSPGCDLVGWGGDLMRQASVHIMRDLDKLAFMGFVEVVAHLPTILANFRIVKRQLKNNRPDILVLIDYPGFNLRLARWAHAQGIPVYYFISPTVWAWKPGRMKIIEQFVTKLYCILPFEKKFYRDHNITNVAYLGNPLIDKVNQYCSSHPKPLFSSEEYIAVLPGSRRQEINLIFPVMAKAMKLTPGLKYKIAHSPSVEKELLVMILEKEFPEWRDFVDIRTGNTYEVLRSARAAIVTSGTATLETGLFSIPQVVCYITGSMNYRIAKKLVNLDYISLINLIAGQEIVKELIQTDCTPEHLSAEMRQIINNSERRKEIISGYQQVKNKLGESGVAERVVADILREFSAVQ